MNVSLHPASNIENTAILEDHVPFPLLQYLEAEQKRLIRDSLLLIQYFEECQDAPKELHDFAFAVFPLAKAYEGFLKTFFFKNGLIAEKVFKGRHFRVGRSFNPDLPERYKDEYWVYDDVSKACSEKLARSMWHVWLDARNHLFHYYPDEKYDLTLPAAKKLILHAVEVMNEAVQCEI